MGSEAGAGRPAPADPRRSLDVSIIMTNWNVRDLLRQAIRSVREKTEGVTYEIIVVDDGSTDGSVEMLRTEFPEITLIVNEKNVGFSKANNQGAEVARGRYILLLNTDTLFIQNTVKIFFDFLEAHPEAGVCGGWLRSPDRSAQVSFGDFPSFHQAVVDALFLNDLFPRAGFPNRGRYPDESITGPLEVDYVTGAGILIRRDIVDRIGFFDELYRAYCEETDFCYRVKNVAGKKVVFLPQAQIIHYGGVSYAKVRKWQTQLLYSSSHKFLLKYHGPFYSMCTRILYAWHHGVKLAVRALRYLTAPAPVQPEKRAAMLNAWYVVRYSLVPDETFTGS